jgi:protein-disulfide isomerase
MLPKGRRLERAVNLGIIVLAAYWLLGANGPARQAIDLAMANHRGRKVWPELVAAQSRLGSSSVPGTVVEFVDYQCPSCAVADSLIRLYMTDIDHVALVVRHLPINSIHPFADDAARAAVCAEAFGIFEIVHHKLFRLWSADRAPPDWDAFAADVGISSDRLQACMRSKQTSERLDVDRRLAGELGVRGTPTFLTERKRHVGVPDSAAFIGLVEGGR